MTSEEYLSELSSVSIQLNESYNRLLILKNANEADKDKYKTKTLRLEKIGKLVTILIKVANKKGKLKKVSALLDLVFATFKRISSEINSIISIAENEIVDTPKSTIKEEPTTSEQSKEEPTTNYNEPTIPEPSK